MPLSLGLDTGGTYTDAVLFDEARSAVLAKAKALTTRHDLAIGIAGAAGAVLRDAQIDPADIALVSVSTTLATNALVEGQGGRVALVMIGFGEADLDRAGLRAALGSDPVIFLPGGHDVHGRASPLDMTALEKGIDALAQSVSAFAVAGYFAVRNPEHELAVRDLIRTRTNRTVTCSHELSAKLDGPRRALTCLLNARLIDMIDRLIEATAGFLADREIAAPLMVVRGDGSLVSAEFARTRPIETILSGPAASLVGARFLTGADDAIVSDIGGTTTDIAILDDGVPRIDPGGATVGGFRTMVDAVAMRTFGLGGDSEVHLDEGALSPVIKLGPRRFVPVSLLAHEHPHVIIHALERQMKATNPGRLDGRFALATGVPEHLAAGLAKSEADLLSRLSTEPRPLDQLLKAQPELATLNRLAARGLALIGGYTPSDAQHVLGKFNHWNREAATLAASLFARRRDGYGKSLADDPAIISRRVVERLERLSADRILETVFCEEGLDGAALAASPLVMRALDRTPGMARLALMIDRPVIALGAGAGAYYPGAADILGLNAIVPDHADVANAVGAVVGQVRVRVEAEIQEVGDGIFEIAGADMDLADRRYLQEEEALEAAEEACLAAVRKKAFAAGAGTGDLDIRVHRDVKAIPLDDRRKFISATISAIATGRPQLVG